MSWIPMTIPSIHSYCIIEELHNLDLIGKSIEVTGEQIYVDRVNLDTEEKQGLAYLDLW
jgi:hypothetical protein